MDAEDFHDFVAGLATAAPKKWILLSPRRYEREKAFGILTGTWADHRMVMVVVVDHP